METPYWCTALVHQYGGRKPEETSGIYFGYLKRFLLFTFKLLCFQNKARYRAETLHTDIFLKLLIPDKYKIPKGCSVFFILVFYDVTCNPRIGSDCFSFNFGAFLNILENSEIQHGGSKITAI